MAQWDQSDRTESIQMLQWHRDPDQRIIKSCQRGDSVEDLQQ